MHRTSKVKKIKGPNTEHGEHTKEANRLFLNLTEALKNGNETERQSAMIKYNDARRNVTRNILISEHKMWNDIISDPRTLWSRVDWNGKMCKNDIDTHPTLNQLKEHFEDIYESKERDEKAEIDQLSSNVYIPLLDDPITQIEVENSLHSCKNGGYDFKNPVMSMFITKFLSVIVLLFNMIFYIRYPINLACSLLNSIPKSGNLLLPQNFRGIQDATVVRRSL